MIRIAACMKWFAALALPALLGAQDISFDLFSSLAPKAAEKVEVNLDSGLLQMAARFLNGKDSDEAKVKGLIAGLKGIYVRSLKFKSPGEYAVADVDRLRAQLKGWNEVVSVRGTEQNTGVFLKSDGSRIQGLVIIAAEPMELTLVNIVGSISPDQVRDLGGKFGIPDLQNVLPKDQKKK